MLTRRIPSQLANRLISAVTGVRLHDYGCTLKAFRREVLTAFHLYGEMHRFIPAYARAAGARITEIPVRHHARQFGKSKYGLGRTIKVLLDLATVRFLTNYATKPMYLFGRIGVLLAVARTLVLLYPPLAHRWLGGHQETLTFVTAGILLILGGSHCVLMGLLAELLMRTSYESQGKRPYLIKRVMEREEARHDIAA